MKSSHVWQIATFVGAFALLVTSIPVSANQDLNRIEVQKTRIERHVDRAVARLVDIKERFENRFADNGVDDDMGDGHEGDHDGGMDHGSLVEVTGPVPSINLVVHKDPKVGYNLEIITTNYTFAPQNASTEHIDGEGHSHLYVDGEKITRVYGNWYYLKAFTEPGEHTIRVELSANDHRAYASGGVRIDDTEHILVD